MYEHIPLSQNGTTHREGGGLLKGGRVGSSVRALGYVAVWGELGDWVAWGVRMLSEGH